MSIYKKQISLRHIIIAIVISDIVTNLLNIFQISTSDIENTVVGLIITAGIASGLGIVG
jgi:hypothetical protein